MINPSQESPYKEGILQDSCINEDLPYKKRHFPPINECQLYTTIKSLKLSQTKVRIILPQLWHFRIVKVL